MSIASMASPSGRLPLRAPVAACGVVFCALLAFSPLLVLVVDRSHSSDWSRLGDIDQACGVLSAFFSGVAVAVVALSIVWQGRQVRVSQVEVQRMFQLEVMKLLLDDPSLREISPESTGSTTREWKMYIVTNLLFVNALTAYEIRQVSPESLRETMAYRFQVPFAREFWPRARQSYVANATTTLRKQFVEITDLEYRRSMETISDGAMNRPRESHHDTRGAAAQMAHDCGAIPGPC